LPPKRFKAFNRNRAAQPIGGLTAASSTGSAMKAHNIRRLCRCPVCGKLGDERSMVKVGPMKTPAHDRCTFGQLGDGIVNLPKEERGKFSLVAVGPDMMRRLADAAG
jgi:hypothetical protein